MKKEVIIVVFLGIIIGAIVMYGIYTARTAITKQQSSPTQELTQISEPTATPTLSHKLIITEPLDETITDQENIAITGKTSPNAILTIIGSENEYLLTADRDGNFSTQISLSGGANQITVSAFNENGDKDETTLTLVYSTAQL